MGNYNLYSDFNIELHKQYYVNYLEVIILPSGKVVYAIPSHQEKLIQIGMKKFQCSRDEFISRCPREMWFDYMTWLLNVTKCVAVWTDAYNGKPNRFQNKKLKQLINAGLLKIPQEVMEK